MEAQPLETIPEETTKTPGRVPMFQKGSPQQLKTLAVLLLVKD